ncbi:hypothetical protein ACOME3_005951 [Neoechinorhynchus agilis]
MVHPCSLLPRRIPIELNSFQKTPQSIVSFSWANMRRSLRVIHSTGREFCLLRSIHHHLLLLHNSETVDKCCCLQMSKDDDTTKDSSSFGGLDNKTSWLYPSSWMPWFFGESMDDGCVPNKFVCSSSANNALRRKPECCQRKPLNIFCGTFNVNSYMAPEIDLNEGEWFTLGTSNELKPVNNPLYEWFKSDQISSVSDVDVFAIALQEVEATISSSYVINDDRRICRYDSLIRSAINSNSPLSVLTLKTLHPSSELKGSPNDRIVDKSQFMQQLRDEFADRIALESLDRTTSSFRYFTRLRLTKLVGIALLVYVRDDHIKHVSNVVQGTIATGVMNFFGNKGAAAISFQLYETTLCFVGAHFQAHDSEVLRRNEDFKTIQNNLLMTYTEKGVSDPPQIPRKIAENDLVFFMGDLNYRLNSPITEDSRMSSIAMLTDANADLLAVSNMLLREEYSKLRMFDQLSIEHKKGNVFVGYYEPPIKFKPTYKFVKDTDKYQYLEEKSEANDVVSLRRRPAWTDRILVGINSPGLFYFSDEVSDSTRPGCVLACEYGSVEKIKFSDHRPVRAIFRVDMIVGLDGC